MPQPTPCTDHPCKGYVYELVYRVSDGYITGVSAYDPCGPPYYDCGATRPIVSLVSGEAWMNIADNPNVVDIMFHAPDYRVDLNTLEIVPRPGTPRETAPEEIAAESNAAEVAETAGPDSREPATWLLAVTGIAIAGTAILATAFWRSRQR